MVRAAAKNHSSVAVVTDPRDYVEVRNALAEGGFDLADPASAGGPCVRAHRRLRRGRGRSGSASSSSPTAVEDGGWPPHAGLALERAAVLRYGENPHQRGALYVDEGAGLPGIAQATQLHGKEMSYNNYVDSDAALRAAYDHEAPAVAIVKHANPCGIAVAAEGEDVAVAHAKAHDCDPVSAFGGVVAANRPVTAAMASPARRGVHRGGGGPVVRARGVRGC